MLFKLEKLRKVEKLQAWENLIMKNKTLMPKNLVIEKFSQRKV